MKVLYPRSGKKYILAQESFIGASNSIKEVFFNQSYKKYFSASGNLKSCKHNNEVNKIMKIPILPCEGNLDYHIDYALYAYIAALSPVLPHQISALKRHYAEKMGCTIRTVERHFNDLIKRGYCYKDNLGLHLIEREGVKVEQEMVKYIFAFCEPKVLECIFPILNYCINNQYITLTELQAYLGYSNTHHHKSALYREALKTLAHLNVIEYQDVYAPYPAIYITYIGDKYYEEH